MITYLTKWDLSQECEILTFENYLMYFTKLIKEKKKYDCLNKYRRKPLIKFNIQP